MSERTYQWCVRAIIAVSFFVLGVSVGNYATRRVLQMNQKILRQHSIMSNSEFCSIDGKVWWPAREADGVCYAADEPRQP